MGEARWLPTTNNNESLNQMHSIHVLSPRRKEGARMIPLWRPLYDNPGLTLLSETCLKIGLDIADLTYIEVFYQEIKDIRG